MFFCSIDHYAWVSYIIILMIQQNSKPVSIEKKYNQF